MVSVVDTLSRQYLKNGLMNQILIWHVEVNIPEGVPYLR